MNRRTALIAAAFFAIAARAFAADPVEITLAIKDHRFVPAEISVPAGQKVKLVVDNQDPTPEEFESHDLNREKVIPGKSRATIWIGPLKPGQYTFVGEYHEDTAKGRVIAK